MTNKFEREKGEEFYMGTLKNEIENNRRKIEELGMFCIKFGIEKSDLQEVASKKIYESQKKEDKRRKDL